jgi:hypothetical protein
MINCAERNLFCVTAAGSSASAVSFASFVYFGLDTYVNIEKLTSPSLCLPDVCEEIKKTALEALPLSVTAAALSALALYVSITLTRQLRAHIIKKLDISPFHLIS